VRPVIFDLDGVLVDSEPLYEAAFHGYVTGVGRSELAPWFENTLGRRQADFAPELGRALDRPPGDVVAGLDTELERVMAAEAPSAMPGAADALRRLGADGRPLGLASSSSRAFIDRVLDSLEFAEAFTATAAGDEACQGKPHPELYLTVAERLDVLPGTCVAVEDTPTGVAAAVAAGMTVLAVPNQLTAELDFSAAHGVTENLEHVVRSIRWLDWGAM
jgi:HAD superfamily hydrolase (TIGR01509 family)